MLMMPCDSVRACDVAELEPVLLRHEKQIFSFGPEDLRRSDDVRDVLLDSMVTQYVRNCSRRPWRTRRAGSSAFRLSKSQILPARMMSP